MQLVVMPDTGPIIPIVMKIEYGRSMQNFSLGGMCRQT